FLLAAFRLGKWISLIYNLFIFIYCFCFFFFLWIFPFSCFSICHALAEVFFLFLKLKLYSCKLLLVVIFKHLCAGIFCIFLGLLLLNFVITLHTPCNYHSVSSFHVLEPAQHPSIIQ
ncbi:hypothetical protein C0J52_19825, partial [Blattella germanica]